MQLETLIRSCNKCVLKNTCREPIPGDGNFGAKILFIGEAPGKDEDIQGKPFVGRSGKLLTACLEQVGLFRDKDYYITNIVKCRPPENRDPKPEEIENCSGYLFEQIQAMKPQVIVTLGRFSMNYLLPDKQISKARGNFFRIRAVQGTILENPVIVFPIFHPAVALYNPNNKQVIIDDIRKLQLFLSKNGQI